MVTGSLAGVNSGRDVTLTPHPLLAPLVKKEQSYTSTPPMGRTACTEVQCLYKGALYLYLTVELYLYSPMGCTACTEPQCLYKGALNLYSRAITLLPLWAVRPVQSLSACTRVHFTFTVELYLYSPYGPYGLYRASVPVQGCTLPLPYTFRKNITFRKVVCLYPFELLVRSEPEWRWILNMDVSRHTIYTNSSFREVCMHACVCVCVCFSEWVSGWSTDLKKWYGLGPIWGCCATKNTHIHT
jgi:hypothetical protein